MIKKDSQKVHVLAKTTTYMCISMYMLLVNAYGSV